MFRGLANRRVRSFVPNKFFQMFPRDNSLDDRRCHTVKRALAADEKIKKPAFFLVGRLVITVSLPALVGFRACPWPSASFEILNRMPFILSIWWCQLEAVDGL